MFKRDLLIFSLTALVTLAASPAGATAIAHSELSFHDVSITPASGTVQFTGPWILQAQASANDSVSGFDNPPIVESDGPAIAGVSAAVAFASANGRASDPAPTPPYLDISGSGTADALIPGQITASASALGRGTVRRDRDNPNPPPPSSYFKIIGGTAGDPVQVTFGVLIDYARSVTTDQYGVLAEAEAIFGQELFGQDVGFQLVNSFVPVPAVLSIGPNDHLQDGLQNLVLNNTLELHYDTAYTLLFEADAEVRVANVPEPSSFGLMLLALPLLYRKRRA
jgi:hypothetical protein